MNAVIIFAKYPEEGKVKTRLGKSLGYKFAAELYKIIYQHTLDICLSLPEDEYKLFLFFDKTNGNIESELIPRFEVLIQNGNDLGEKMKNAFQEVFSCSYQKVIIIGTDCPELNAGILLRSFEGLSGNDVVIGPSNDGGYYLLGMNKQNDFLFNDIEWSTDQVFGKTIKKLNEYKLNFALLTELNDIDTEEDFTKWISKPDADNYYSDLLNKFRYK